MTMTYAQKCNWCDWKDVREILETCPDCGKSGYLMDLPKLDEVV